MPNEPEREIEKTLKAYAKQRRAEAGAPRELHPATRRVLQAEAARARAKARGGADFWPRLLGGSWPRWAMAFCALVLLAVAGSLFFWNGSKKNVAPVQMAKAQADFDGMDRNRQVRKEVPRPAARAAVSRPAVIANPKPALDSNKSPAPSREVAEMEKFRASTASPPPALPSVASSSPAEDKSGSLANRNFKLAADSPIAPSPAPSVAIGDTSAVIASAGEGGRTIAGAGTVVKKFARESMSGSTAGLLKDGADSSVLVSFQVEMTGDNIRIVDGDGSVYAGRLEQPGANELEGVNSVTGTTIQPEDAIQRRYSSGAAKGAPQRAAPRVNASVASIPATNYFFRVTGTNLSLKQVVVFTGSFAGNASPLAAAPADSPVHLDAPTNSPLGLSNLRIVGRAMIGKNQSDISAKAKN